MRTADGPPNPLTTANLAAATTALRASFDAEVRVTGHDVLKPDGHSYVARLHLADAPVDTAVIKLAHRDADGEFDPGDNGDQPGGNTPALLWNEWAGLRFLRTSNVSAVPTFYAGDRERGFVLMGDLGDGPSLATVLLGSDPARARTAFEGYVDALAEVHLATFGKAAEYDEIRSRLGPELGFMMALRQEQWPNLRTAIAELDGTIELTADMDAAVERIDQVLEDPAWQAYSPNDCCPDNNRVHDDGTVTLFDLEFGSFHHALRDVAYLLTTMPTCWCVRRTPDGLAEALIARYHRRLVAAGRDVPVEEFWRMLRHCQAYWSIWTLAWQLAAGLRPDGAHEHSMENYDFRMVSRREQVDFRAGQLADAAATEPELESLCGLADALRAAANRVWGPFRGLPVYPAFGQLVD